MYVYPSFYYILQFCVIQHKNEWMNDPLWWYVAKDNFTAKIISIQRWKRIKEEDWTPKRCDSQHFNSQILKFFLLFLLYSIDASICRFSLGSLDLTMNYAMLFIYWMFLIISSSRRVRIQKPINHFYFCNLFEVLFLKISFSTTFVPFIYQLTRKIFG